MVLELLADAPHLAGRGVEALPTKGTHSSIVFDLYQVAEIRAELIGGNGVATERMKHADIVSFTCLKAFAFDERYARKHADVVRDALNILQEHSADDATTEGYRKDGLVAVAKFEFGDTDGPEQRGARDLIARLLAGVG